MSSADFLRARGYRVTLVQNFTDVDDKIIERAKERGMDPLELAAQYSEAYLTSMDRAGRRAGGHLSQGTEHIAEIIAMIERLIEKGSAYASRRERLLLASSRFPTTASSRKRTSTS